MSKETFVGGDIIEFIGGKDLSYAKEEIINIGSQVIQNGKETGVSYGTNRKAPERETKYIVKGEWRDTENKIITKAKVGDYVQFCIETKGIPEKKNVKLKLREHDGSIYIPLLTLYSGIGYTETRPFDDDIQLTTTDAKSKKSTPFTQIDINKEGKASFGISLDEGLDQMIADDSGAFIELYFSCSYEEGGEINVYLPKVTDNYLKVGFSDRTLFIKPAIDNGKYGLPELRSKIGETVLFAIDQSPEKALKRLKTIKVRKTTTTKLLKGLTEYKKTIYEETIDLHTNKSLIKGYEVTEANDYFRITKDITLKDVEETQKIIKKGLKDYINIYDVGTGVLKVAKVGAEIWNSYQILVEMREMMPELNGDNEFKKPDLGTLIGAVPGLQILAMGVSVMGWIATDMLKEMNEMVDEKMLVTLENCKEMGVPAIQQFLQTRWAKEKNYNYIEISQPLLQKLLKGEIRNLRNLTYINDNIQPKKDDQIFQETGHHPQKYFVLYSTIKDSNKKKDDLVGHNTIIETIFILN